MITISLTGGLGNQMSQYAFARKLSLKHQIPLRIDITGFETYKLHKYCLDFFTFHKELALSKHLPFYRRFSSNNPYINYFLNKFKWLFTRMNPYHTIEKGLNFNSKYLQVSSGFIEGFFQTEKYFLDIEDVLRQDFTFSIPPSFENQKIIDIIKSSNAISVHVRRGDYVSNSTANNFHGTCNIDYYERAMTYMKEHIKKPVFFFFSDDIIWVKENIKTMEESYYIDFNDANHNYEDMRLMSLCNHNIIANSSFSWWGAWLNAHKEKIVIAPSKWLNNTDADYSDIIPDTWMKI